MNHEITEINRLEQDRDDLIRALDWLHDNTLKHIQCEDRRKYMAGVENALDRAWEILEEMKQSK